MHPSLCVHTLNFIFSMFFNFFLDAFTSSSYLHKILHFHFTLSSILKHPFLYLCSHMNSNHSFNCVSRLLNCYLGIDILLLFSLFECLHFVYSLPFWHAHLSIDFTSFYTTHLIVVSFSFPILCSSPHFNNYFVFSYPFHSLTSHFIRNIVCIFL